MSAPSEPRAGADAARTHQHERVVTAAGELIPVQVSEVTRIEERHLGDRLAAFVDGELNHSARERVLVHLADCDACRAAADEQRRMKSALADTAPPGPGGDLLARLMALPDRAAGPGEPGSPETPEATEVSEARGEPGVPPSRTSGSGADSGPIPAPPAERTSLAARPPAPLTRHQKPSPAGLPQSDRRGGRPPVPSIRRRRTAPRLPHPVANPASNPMPHLNLNPMPHPLRAGVAAAAAQGGRSLPLGGARGRRLALVAAFSAAAMALSGTVVAGSPAERTAAEGSRSGTFAGRDSPRAAPQSAAAGQPRSRVRTALSSAGEGAELGEAGGGFGGTRPMLQLRREAQPFASPLTPGDPFRPAVQPAAFAAPTMPKSPKPFRPTTPAERAGLAYSGNLPMTMTAWQFSRG